MKHSVFVVLLNLGANTMTAMSGVEPFAGAADDARQPAASSANGMTTLRGAEPFAGAADDAEPPAPVNPSLGLCSDMADMCGVLPFAGATDAADPLPPARPNKPKAFSGWHTVRQTCKNLDTALKNAELFGRQEDLLFKSALAVCPAPVDNNYARLISLGKKFIARRKWDTFQQWVAPSLKKSAVFCPDQMAWLLVDGAKKISEDVRQSPQPAPDFLSLLHNVVGQAHEILGADAFKSNQRLQKLFENVQHDCNKHLSVIQNNQKRTEHRQKIRHKRAHAWFILPVITLAIVIATIVAATRTDSSSPHARTA